MLMPITQQQSEIASFIKRHAPHDGIHATPIPSLFLVRQSDAPEPIYSTYKPSLCLVAHGQKELWLAQEHFQYGTANYLIAAADLPITGQILEASSDIPYLSIKLEFTSSQMLDIIHDSQSQGTGKQICRRALFVSRLEESLLDAILHLIRLLDTPQDIPVLAPLFTKEILYRVLQGEHGALLKQMFLEGSLSYRIKEVISYITLHYEKSFRIETLAELASMSVSSLHRHFKEVTAMSPIQFQKQLRLREARRLLLTEATDVSEAAFRVGYESPSQFSREYSHMFGLAPREDIKRLRFQQ